MSATDRQREALQSQIGPVVQDLGFDLDGIAVTRVGRRVLVRITVDSDAGIDLDGIADVSRRVSATLDADDPFNSPFVLEVSSPGVDRPLTEPRHWRRNIGRLVQTEIGGQAITGRVAAVDGSSVRMSCEGGDRTVEFADLSPGRIQVEFGRSADRVDEPVAPPSGPVDRKV